MTTANLANRAMLARLTITQWSARKLDKRVTSDAITAESAASDAGRFNKNLLAGGDAGLKEIARIATAARTEHYRLTLPWTDDGARILTAAGFREYAAAMDGFRRQFEAAVTDFARNEYPTARDRARFALGKMFNEGEYPSAYEIENRFGFATAVDPLPMADDFRCTLSDDAVKAIQADLQSRMSAAEADAMRDVWRRLFDVVSHMAISLPKYTDGQIKRFNDTLVDNIRDLCRILPALNLSQDATLADMAGKVEAELCRFSPQTLRDCEQARQSTADAAAAITRQMAAYMGQPAPTIPVSTTAAPAPVIDLFNWKATA